MTAPSSPGRDQQSQGFLLGVAAYAMWGLFPLYWPLLEPSSPVEVLAHRVVWSLVVMGALVVLTRRTAQLRSIVRDRRRRRLLAAAAVVVTVNWGGFIYGVAHGLVVETSLGYFINPLVTVLMGVVLLKETLRPWQWAAIGIAVVAVVGLAVEYGRPPWISLLLAFSFGTYGLLKKRAGADAIESLTFETMVIAPVALAYLVWLGLAGRGHFLGHGPGHVVLLATTGLVTAIPLLCFGAAAIRVPMTTLGLLQYIAPILQFVIGVAVVHEEMTSMRWVGFVLVWVALVVFTADALRHRRRPLRESAEAAAV
ncbi:EamA family transporter RarD [Nocardioides mangrovicus]|uniref:EamA family transporter RarD n=2 Tax=Nocardioides mangrovicus TaxID=2478913 RepID=A0A3L8P6Y4_9ACTN|nr:EamA family transporter RarD [Nocardioides mangrovicus]